ncbi:MAG TPA: LPS export ABC transporter periplasmic protein LptC [Caulobacteraceae bacterium]|nr:LPS export ABC transporter periplasmic protein LptC [Caulobacteraceae bacterium]
MTINPAAGAPLGSSVVRRRARAHSRLVHLLRWLLPGAIGAILAALGVFVALQALRSEALRPREIPTQIRMVSPHFIGRDDRGRAYDLAARLAVRNDRNMQAVLLTDPVMVLDVDSAHPKTLTADRGVYDENTRLLRLTGHVRMDDASASAVATDEALVDTRAGTVSGRGPIAGRGPTGSIFGRSYTANEKSGVVVIRGGVHGELKGR